MSDMNTPEVTVEAPPAADPAMEAPVSGPEVPALEPVPVVPVLAQQPSSAEAPEAESDGGDETPVSLEDAARAVVLFVKAHRTVGDADLGAALADLESALAAPPTTDVTFRNVAAIENVSVVQDENGITLSGSQA